MKNNQKKNHYPMVFGTGEYSFEDEYTVVDIETSGLDPTQDEIIEIGAVIVRSGTILQRFHTLVKAEHPLQLWAVKLTGITDEMLKNAPNSAAALEMLMHFFGERPLVMHNAKFTLGFLKEQCQRFDIPCDQTCIDVLGIAKHLFPEMESYKLKHIAHRVGVPICEDKRPLGCAEVCAKVLVFFFDEFRKNGINSMQAIREYERGVTHEQ